MRSVKSCQILRILMIIVIISLLILPNFDSIGSFKVVLAGIEQPENLPEVKTTGVNLLRHFPSALRESWQEALKIWQEMAQILKKLWNSFIEPKIQVLWQKIKGFLRKEVKVRKPIIKQEFREEKTELKTEIPKLRKSLWQKFKELIK